MSKARSTQSTIAVRTPASSLFSGSLSGRTVQCRAHGLRFDLVTGCMSGAGGFGVKTYRIEVRDGRTFLTMPEATSQSSC